LSIHRKTIVYTLLVVGLLMLSPFGVIRGQNAGPAASARIIACIKSEDVVCVSEFLSHGGSTKAVDEKGVPLLGVASEANSRTMLRLLLNAGADPNFAGSGDEAPICRAALFGRKDAARTLLEAGAKASVICDADHGDSALMTALRGEMMSDLPTDLKDTTLNPEDLVESDDSETEKTEKVAKFRDMLSTSGDDYLEIARMLLAQGADVKIIAKCDVGESALMYAAMASDVEMVKTLLAHGADAKGESPILYLLRQTETEYRRAKLTPVPVFSRQQQATVDWADETRTRREEIVRLLKAAGAEEDLTEGEDVELKVDPEEFARDAFNDVIQRNDLKDFERLVDAYATHPLGKTTLTNALWGAVVHARVEMVKLLLERGVNPNAPVTVNETTKYTHLMQAASSADFGIVKLLLDAGADINAQNEKGRTALDEVESYAGSSESHRKMAAFLKERGGVNGTVKK
jgi:ankyrin repeat protein